MSKGIWTKHITQDESGEWTRYYYYNAAQNRSVWHVPKDAIVHEAIRLAIPSKDLNSSEFYEEKIGLSESDSFADQLISSIESSLQSKHNNNFNNNIEYSAPLEITPSTTLPPPSSTVPSSLVVDINDRIQQAVAQNKEKFLTTNTNSGNKRFKHASGQAIVSAIAEESLSEYEKQKSALEAREGNKGENAGKWLVR